MSGSVNKAIILVAAYEAGLSLTEVAARHAVSVSTARHHILRAGKLRSRQQGLALAAASGKLGVKAKGVSRTFTGQHKANIRTGRRAWGKANAAGVSVKPTGYEEFTTGEHKGRSVHVVRMEQRLGRRLKPDENVHHIDGNKRNNADNNLALVTRSGHNRLHRLQDAMSNKIIERASNGRFC